MAGVAQGCPLSSYLFIAVQSVMLHNVLQDTGFEAEPAYAATRDILRADDALLVSHSPAYIQNMLNVILADGQKY
eukprot:5220319-Pyramimonas_sp.AAC.1